jgi:hypothetical protein
MASGPEPGANLEAGFRRVRASRQGAGVGRLQPERDTTRNTSAP